MADGVSDDGSGDEPLVLPAPAGPTDAQSLITLMRAEMRTNRQEAQKAQDQMKELQSQLSMMLQTMMPAMITQVRTPDNHHSNESESTNSESCSVTSNCEHNTRSSRNENKCKKVTFENTTPTFLNVLNTPANSHSNESASIKSASHSAKANQYKNTTFENTTTNAELLTQPTRNLTVTRPSQLMTQPPKNLADQETENEYHKLISIGTTRPLPKKYRNPSKSTPTAKRVLAADADQHLRDTNCGATSFLAHARPDPLTTNELVNELRPLSRLRP
jgi:hypothetical protein